ncbi:MAG: hypothetical protein CBD74_12390 [Saprospirales bacterium TMED214]|nr:MAG: hypothetical protein CBD74_12390 [Saprospirales bacterium TMED214]
MVTMVNRIALLIDSQHLHLLQGATGGHSIEPTLARSIRIPDALRFDEAPDKFSDWLIQELADLGVSAKRTVFALESPYVLQKCITLPVRTDNDLAKMVELHVAGSQFIKAEQARYDFLIESRRPDNKTGVLLALTTAELVNSYQHTFACADLKLDLLTTANYACTNYVRTQLPEAIANCDLLIFKDAQHLRLTALVDSSIVALHEERIGQGPEDPEQLIQAIRRFRGSVSQNVDDHGGLNKILVLCSKTEHETLAPAIQAEFGTKPEIIDFESIRPENIETDNCSPQALCCLQGLLMMADASRSDRLDILHPTGVKSTRQKQLISVFSAIGIACVLLIIAISYIRHRSAVVNGEFTTLQAELNALTEKNQKGQSIIAKVNAMRDWEKTNINWFHEITELQKRMPDSKQAYFSELDLVARGIEEPPKATASGFAKKQSDVMQMNEEFSSDSKQFVVNPKPFFESDVVEKFPLQFELDIELIQPQLFNTNARKNTAKDKSTGKKDTGQPDVLEQ